MQEIETIRRALSTANTNFYIDALEALAKLEAKLNKPVDVEKVSKAEYLLLSALDFVLHLSDTT